MDNRLMTVDEAAKALGISVPTAYRWCTNGHLPTLKIGRKWYIRRDAFEDMLRKPAYGSQPVPTNETAVRLAA